MAWPFSRESRDVVASDQEPTRELPVVDPGTDGPTEVMVAPDIEESVSEGVLEPVQQTDALDEWRRQFELAHEALAPTAAPVVEVKDDQTVWGEVEERMRAGDVEAVRHMVGLDEPTVLQPPPEVAMVRVEPEPALVSTTVEPEPRSLLQWVSALEDHLTAVRLDVTSRLDHHTEQLTSLATRIHALGDLGELMRRVDLIETSVAGESEDPTVAMEAMLRSLPDNGYKAFALQRWSEVLHASALCRNGDAILKSLGTIPR